MTHSTPWYFIMKVIWTFLDPFDNEIDMTLSTLTSLIIKITPLTFQKNETKTRIIGQLIRQFYSNLRRVRVCSSSLDFTGYIIQENVQDCGAPPPVLCLHPLSSRIKTQETGPRQPILSRTLSTEFSWQRWSAHKNILWTSNLATIRTSGHSAIKHFPDIRRTRACQCVWTIWSIQSNFRMMKKISVDELCPTKIIRF